MVVDKLGKTARLNNMGIEYENRGDTQSAIEVYEANLKIGYPAQHSYNRLMKIYRRLRLYKKEQAVIEKAIQVFGRHNEDRYQMAINDDRKAKYKDQIDEALETCGRVYNDEGWIIFSPVNIMIWITRLERVKALILKQSK